MPFDLPPYGTRESQELDFKAELSTRKEGKTDHLELAKDMAAMANAYGGAIVVGACESPKGTLSLYRPFPKEKAAGICDQYALALRDRLRPAPIVTFETIEHESEYLVVVRIEASAGQAIGVRFVPKDDLDQGESKAPREAYGFPLRVGDNTTWLEPEQLPMLMLPELRRTILLLRKIGNDPVKLHKVFSKHTEYGTNNYTIVRIEPELNSVWLTNDFSIPIDRIRSIYRTGKDWQIQWVLF
jgi:hypothetical protein